jgi:monoamine oxidase
VVTIGAMTSQRNQIEVLVVGAGLAGLVAARDLQEQGHAVTVVEAAQRVGGRTFSAPFPGTGTVVDLGAEWISPRHTALLAEYERYGVGLAPRAAEGVVRWRFGDEVVTGDLPLDAAEQQVVEAVFAQLAEQAALLLEQGVDAYEPAGGFDDSYAALLDRLGAAGRARDVLAALGYALMGAFPHEYSVASLIRETAAFGGDPREAFLGELDRAEGGTDRICRLIAETLHDVRLGAVVRAIDAGGTGVTVTLDDGATVDAAAVVVAVPLNVLEDVAISPAPPADVRAYASARHAGRAVKTWLRVDGAAPGETIFSSEGPIEAYTLAADTGAVLLGAFHLDDDAARVDATVAAERLSAFYPGIAVHEVFGHDWNTDPFSRGTWLAARPGQWALQRAFWGAAPDGIVYAGGDVAREWAGWMEGAVRSGREAAAQVGQLLGTAASA